MVMSKTLSKSFGFDPDDLQLHCMGYTKNNGTVLIDNAYHNNIVNQIALFFDFDVIIGNDVVISDGNIR